MVAWLGSGVGSGDGVGVGVGAGVGDGVGDGVCSGSLDGSGVGTVVSLTGVVERYGSSLGSKVSDGEMLDDGCGSSDGSSLVATISDDPRASAVSSGGDAIIAAPMQAAMATINGSSICFCFFLKNFTPNTIAHIKAITQAREKKVCILVPSFFCVL